MRGLPLLALLVFVARPAAADPIFAHTAPWASAAFETLARHGVLIGQPDGTFRGDAPVSRYEVAIAANRLLRELRVERPHSHLVLDTTLRVLAPEAMVAFPDSGASFRR